MQKFVIRDNPQPRTIDAWNYLLGVYFGDGSISIHPKYGNYYFRLNAIDRDFVENTAKAIECITGKKPPIYIVKPTGFGKKYKYETVFYSKKICEKIITMTKNKTILPKLNTKQKKLSFVAGVMDSEGFIQIGKRDDRPNNQIQIGITVCGTWIDDFIKIFQSIGVQCGKKQQWKVYEKTVTRYLIKVKDFVRQKCFFTIKRKQVRLRDYTRNAQTGYIDTLGRRYSPTL